MEDKIPDITNVATKTTLHAKINEVKDDMPNITNLAANASLNAIINEVKGKILTWLLLVFLLLLKIKYPVLVIQKKKKTDHNTKINETENEIIDHNDDKYITAPEFNKLTENLAARLKQVDLASKSGIANFVHKTFQIKVKVKNVTSNKNELNEISKKV